MDDQQRQRINGAAREFSGALVAATSIPLVLGLGALLGGLLQRRRATAVAQVDDESGDDDGR